MPSGGRGRIKEERWGDGKMGGEGEINTHWAFLLFSDVRLPGPSSGSYYQCGLFTLFLQLNGDVSEDLKQGGATRWKEPGFPRGCIEQSPCLPTLDCDVREDSPSLQEAMNISGIVPARISPPRAICWPSASQFPNQ